MADLEYLLEPMSDGVEMTIAIRNRTRSTGVQLIVRDEHVNSGAAVVIDATLARAIVKALLPLCPEPYPAHPLTREVYPPMARDIALVHAAARVLEPVFAYDDPHEDFGNEPF